MLVQFYPLREFSDRGGSLVWRLVVQRFLYEGAGSATVSCTAPSCALGRTWTVTTYDDAETDLKLTNDYQRHEYSGTVTDTVTFTGPGIAVYDITDTLSPVRTPDIVEVEAVVNGVQYDAHGYATGDDFTRSAALDGQLVLQKLLTVARMEDEEFLEDMLMQGWNFATWLRWMEQLDGYVLALRTNPLDAIPTVISLSVTDPTGSAITAGDGKSYWRVPPALDGKSLTGVWAGLVTASSSGAVVVQIANVTGGYDHLVDRLTIDVNETSTTTAATPPTIDTASSHDVVETGDLLRFDIDSAGTSAVGLQVVLTFSA